MGILDQTRFVERHQFFAGQRLLANDLQGLEAFHREMRELHNRSLHQPGIGNGFAVSGEPGDREVKIGAGYALDAEGREIVLTREHGEPVPPVAGGDDGEPAYYHLTVSYPDDDDLEESETRRGVCATHGTVRLREEPVFCWVRLTRDNEGKLNPVDQRLSDAIQLGLKVVLALLEVEHCQLKSRPLLSPRRNARPATQPRIVCGHERAPGWRLHRVAEVTTSFPGVVAADVYALTGRVRTAAANFRTTPAYFARIDGPRWLEITAPTISPPTQSFFADGLLSVGSGAAPEGTEIGPELVEVGPDGFPVHVLLFLSPPTVLDSVTEGELAGAATAAFQPWTIQWMGIE